MTKILVTGGNGQLAQCLKDVVKNDDELDVDFQDLPYLDITDKQQLEAYFSKNELKVNKFEDFGYYLKANL